MVSLVNKRYKYFDIIVSVHGYNTYNEVLKSVSFQNLSIL